VELAGIMTVNTPDIRPVRRGIVARFLGDNASSMGVRHSRFSGAASQAWSKPGWRPHRTEARFEMPTDADAAGRPMAIDNACGPNPNPLGGWPKRALDLTVASTALLLALPLMLVVALLIKVISGGPVLFAHRRIGFNGRPFNCYKFRTMVKDAEQVLEEYLARDPRAAEEWRATQKLKHDPRITLLGQILRKSSIDELPQLVNVLRGEMSCVGPRPVVSNELSRYGPLAEEYLKTRPGLTGLWQISGRDNVDYAGRVVLDAEYVRNWSIGTDLVILAWTALAVMRFDQAS
jgi:exopolysaccharide production protein ExoY